jgi:hypothetical protein
VSTEPMFAPRRERISLVPRLFSRGDPPPPMWTLLVLAAVGVGVGVAGYLHGRLFWEGYDHVAWVGPCSS